MLCAGAAEKRRVAEGEDAAVGGHQPVAVAVGSRRHADDRLVEVNRSGAAVELRVPVGEDTAVGRDQPVAVLVRRRRHAHHRTVEMDAAGGAEEARVGEAEHAAVAGGHPVAAAARSEAHHRRVVATRVRQPDIAIRSDGDAAAAERVARLRWQRIPRHRPVQAHPPQPPTGGEPEAALGSRGDPTRLEGDVDDADGTVGADVTDAVVGLVGEPEVAVGAGGDVGGAVAGARQREGTHHPGRSDAADHRRVAIGEPHVAVRPSRQSGRLHEGRAQREFRHRAADRGDARDRRQRSVGHLGEPEIAVGTLGDLVGHPRRRRRQHKLADRTLRGDASHLPRPQLGEP